MSGTWPVSIDGRPTDAPDLRGEVNDMAQGEYTVAVEAAVGQYKAWRYNQQQADRSQLRLHRLVARLTPSDFAAYAAATQADDDLQEARELAAEQRAASAALEADQLRPNGTTPPGLPA
jgi:hypothetical protein